MYSPRQKGKNEKNAHRHNTVAFCDTCHSEKPATAIVGSSEERLGRVSLGLKIREDVGVNWGAQWQQGETEGVMRSVFKRDTISGEKDSAGVNSCPPAITSLQV